MSGTNEALTAFTAGDLVISVVGDDDGSGNYTDNQAAPIALEEITTTGTVVGQMVLPQTTTVVDGVTENAISGEYGSSSEGSLQLSADGQSLVIMGYGVNAQTYNEGGAAVYGDAALAQSTSVPGGQYTPVARVVADISYNGTVDTSTAIYNIDNTNNPRSVATVNGTSFYISGQGVKGDGTQGVFVAQDGASSATAIDTSTDTRTVEIVDGVLYVSRDSTQGGGGTSNIESYGTTLPTGATVGTALSGIDGTITLTAAQANGIDDTDVGQTIHLSPENFFFASPDVLYIADGGDPKAGGLGDGGLQKWVYSDGTWNLAYTVSDGLNLVADTATSGTTGLIGLTGTVVGGVAYLYATNSTLGDLDQTYLYGIADTLSATTDTGESFTQIAAAAADTNIRGVSFAPSAAATTIADTVVSAGSPMSGTQVTSGSTLDVLSGGIETSGTIFAGGSATVELGGVDSGSYIAQGGEETVLGSATGDTVAGIQLISVATGVVSNETILNGGTVELFKAGAVANNLVVDSGGSLFISGAATANDTVISGGAIELQSPKAMLSGAVTFEGAGAIVVTVNSTTSAGYGDLAVISGFGAADVIDFTSTTSIGSAGSAATFTSVISAGDTYVTVSGGSATETFEFAGTTIASGLTLGADGYGGEALTYSAPPPPAVTVSNGVTSTGLAVTSGGMVDVLSGGTLAGATISSGGNATIEIGGLDSGSVITAGGHELVLGSATSDQVYGTQLVSAAGAVVSNETVYNGGAVDLFLKGGVSDNIIVSSGGSLNISGNASATDTVLDGGLLTMQSSKSVISGSLTFNGGGTLEISTLISAGYGDFAVISGFGVGDVIDETVFGSGTTLSTTVSGSDTIATITGGGVTSAFTFAGTTIGASLTLQSDGNGGEEITVSAPTPTSTTVMSGVTSTGNVVTFSSFVDVLSGGTLVSATIQDGGSATVELGGTDSGSVISAGGFETVSGMAIGDQVYGTQLLSASTAAVSNETIYNGGTAELFLAGVTADNLTVMSGGTIAINGRGSATDTVLSGGSLILESAKATLSGSLTFAGPATLQETATVSVTSGGRYFGDMATISGFGAGDVIDFTNATAVGSAGSAATITSTTSGSETYVTVSGGGSTETFIFAGTTIGSSLALQSDGQGGEEIVFTGSSSSTTTSVTSGTPLNVSSGTTVSGAVVTDGGLVVVSGGGVTSDTVLSAGGDEEISSGGSAGGITVGSGGYAVMLAGGTASGIEVNADGFVDVYGAASGTSISGGYVTVEGTDTGTSVSAGGIEIVASSGSASGTTLSAGGDQAVSAGGFAGGTTVDSGGYLVVSSGGTASDAAVNSGAFVDVYGTNSGTTVSGGYVTVYGTDRGMSVSAGGIEVVSSGGWASGTTLAAGGDQAVLSGGSASGTMVGSGGYAVVSAGGTASGMTVTSGGFADVRGTNTGATLSGGYVTVYGTDSGTTVSAGGMELVVSGGSANGTTLRAGGDQAVSAGGLAVGTIVSSGGYAVVLSGGMTQASVVGSGGMEFINSGGSVLSGLTISGGSAVISGSAAAGTTVTFAGTGGYLGLDNTSGFAAMISGFSTGDQIGLGTFAFGSGVTDSFTAAAGGTSGTLTVVDGSQQVSLTLAGAYNTGDFTLSAGTTGTVVKFT